MASPGRLGRGLRNTLAEALDSPSLARLPYPFQGHLVAALKQAALTQGRFDLAPFWSGQSAPLIRHHQAAALFDALVREASDVSDRASLKLSNPHKQAHFFTSILVGKPTVQLPSIPKSCDRSCQCAPCALLC